MPVEALHCPTCGAPAASDAKRCAYCGVPLATVECPACFGMMFAGASFCPRCGASAARIEVVSGEERLCPRCQVDMKAFMIGASSLRECPQCEGMWTPVETLQQICTQQEKQAAVLGMSAPQAAPLGVEKSIRYLPCPVCRKLMNRVNFAHSSHVIVDVCKEHGTWFDKDELRRTIEFIRAGGLEKARANQMAQIESERRKLEATKNAGIVLDLEQSPFSNRDHQSGLVTDLFRFLLD